MSDENTITLNPSKSSELEFDVRIQGMDSGELPMVRFVVIGSESNYDHTFRCDKSPDDKHGWIVQLPALPDVISDNTPFRVEVIVDGYYFEPAQGSIKTVEQPDIIIGDKKSTKPTVSTSFKVKQVGEAAGGREVTGQSQITNQLLTPEFEPRSSITRPPEDEAIDLDKLDGDAITNIASGVIPGQGTADTELAAKFDPKQTATDILTKTIGKLKRPEKPGSLFTRRDGKAKIPGLVDPDIKRTQELNAQSVREIIKSTQ